MTKRTGEYELASWLERAEADDQPELHTFATGIRQDLAAVTAGLTLPYSSGPTEVLSYLSSQLLACQRQAKSDPWLALPLRGQFHLPSTSPSPRNLGVLTRPGFDRAHSASPALPAQAAPPRCPAATEPAAKVSHFHSNRQHLTAHVD